MGGSLPPWLTPEGQSRGARRRQNRRSGAQEAARAREVGGRVQAGSGTSWRSKGDVRSEGYTEEMKYTDSRSYALTEKVMRTIIRAAEQQGREPRIVVDFVSLGIRATIELGDLP